MRELPVSIEGLQAAARRRLPRQIADFIDGGAGDETTLRANRTAFDRVRLRPEWLVDVSHRTLATTVLGDRVTLPVLLAPVGMNALVHREGELAAARAAGAAGTVTVVSTGSTYTIEEIARVATGPLWFQLYLWRDREVVASLVQRARQAGFTTLVLTVDVPIVGRRDRDLRNGMTLPPRIRARDVIDAARRPRWLREYAAGPRLTFRNVEGYGFPVGDPRSGVMAYVNRELTNPAATWDELARLRDAWPGRLVVKGILTGEDAVRAMDAGADGVVVSNHGGRQLDGVPATIEALPEVVAAAGDRGAVLLDGGVRRGIDVVRALALGADAVLVGRPYVWGLAVAGRPGVRHALELLRTELDAALALMGRPDVAQLDASAVAVDPAPARPS